MDLFFRGQEQRLKTHERLAYRRAFVQAYHTDRFARLKKLGPRDLNALLKVIEQPAKPAGPRTPRQLWDLIAITHAAIEGDEKRQMKLKKQPPIKKGRRA